MAIELISGGTIEGLKAVAAQLQNRRPLLVQVSYRGGVELRAWFLKRNTAVDSIGGRQHNFWLKIRSSVSASVLTGSKARVSVTDYRFNQKVYGGRIRPKRAKALTVPAKDAPEARGLSVRSFERATGIQLFLLRKKGGGLTNLLAGAIGSSAHQFKVYYTLQPYVDQAADPEALPPREPFNQALLDEADRTLRRALNRGSV